MRLKRNPKLDKRDAEIISLHKQGLLNKDIAKKFDLTPATIWTVLRNNGLRSNRPKRSYDLTPEMLAQARTLDAQGAHPIEIATALGVSVAWFRKHVDSILRPIGANRRPRVNTAEAERLKSLYQRHTLCG